MAGKKKENKQQETAQGLLARRLELIRKRHRQLILEPREVIAADFAADLDDVLGDLLEPEELELANATAVDRKRQPVL